ncbi:MAG: GGDEF and EAL domain-containing protein [Pseudomonadota bacterium]
MAAASSDKRTHRIGRDLLFCGFGTLVLGLALAEMDFFERIYDFTRQHEAYELDEIICVFLILPIFASLLAYQRILDLNEEVRARQAAERANLELARTDPLTGLANRRQLDDVLRRLAASADRSDTSLAVMHIDLDRFKQINDTLGHNAGDHVLRYVATLLTRMVDSSDLVARIGGDEFVVVMSHGQRRGELEALAMQVIDDLKRPVQYGGHACYVGASIGIALTDGVTASEPPDPARLVTDADIALYRAKECGGGRCEFYSSALRTAFEARKTLSDEILAGIDRREFVPYYQMQFDAVTHEVVGIEALARWHHPKRGVLVPDAFLETAAFLNAVLDIDRIVLQKVVSDMHEWQRQGVDVGTVSVNVSAQRLKEPEFLETLRRLDVPHGMLSFELSEAIYFDACEEEVRGMVKHIRDLGFGIEIDDFGTGHASIVSVTELRPNRLKVDRSLIAPLIEAPEQRELIKIIVDMGRSLGIGVTAEGIESMEHAAIARDLGCDVLQGFAFAIPLCKDDVTAQLAERNVWTVA